MQSLFSSVLAGKFRERNLKQAITVVLHPTQLSCYPLTLLTNSMDFALSKESNFLDTQRISSILQNSKIYYYRVQKSFLLVSYPNPDDQSTVPSCFLRTYFNIILQFITYYSKWGCPQCFRSNLSCTPLHLVHSKRLYQWIQYMSVNSASTIGSHFTKQLQI
jgi:hypothetical protein